MLKFISNNVIHYMLLASAVFCALWAMLDVSFLITVLNGAFFGTMFGITVAYAPLFWRSLRNDETLEPDVQQMVLSFLGTWAAYVLVVYASVYLRMADMPVSSLLVSAISRYIAIVSAIAQITAPAYGKAFFYGRERKSLYVGLASGIVMAILLVVAQTSTVLANEALRL